MSEFTEKNQNLTVIDTTIEEMSSAVHDIILDMYREKNEDKFSMEVYESNVKLLQLINSYDYDEIRKAFRDGNTVILLGNKAGMLDTIDRFVIVIRNKRNDIMFIVSDNDCDW
jgi:alpha-amylase/alpha-mannosidase (GH57 family)